TCLSPAPLEYRSRERMTRHHVGGVTGWLGATALWGLERACLRRASRIQVLSDYAAGQLWQLYRIAADRLVKIPGGVDLRLFRPADDRAAVRARLDLPKEAPLLLTVRNLELRMGLDTLLRAMPLVVSRRADAQLLIAGGGSSRGCGTRRGRTPSGTTAGSARSPRSRASWCGSWTARRRRCPRRRARPVVNRSVRRGSRTAGCSTAAAPPAARARSRRSR